jgi:hypothetical protein
MDFERAEPEVRLMGQADLRMRVTGPVHRAKVGVSSEDFREILRRTRRGLGLLGPIAAAPCRSIESREKTT